MMARRLLAILAHPDDETLGFGGTLARYASEGVETFLVTATHGERGRYFPGAERPADTVVGRTRATELMAAARELGLRDVSLLGLPDGSLASVDPTTVVPRLARVIRTVRPDVVLTFDPFGGYGHPDHVAISQLTSAAVLAAAYPDPGGGGSGEEPFQVAKLYYLAWDDTTWAAYERALKPLVVRLDGVERRATPWPGWSVTTRIDASDHWRSVLAAVRRHRTQTSAYETLDRLTDAEHASLWGRQSFYRAISLVPTPPGTETDLFDGIPDHSPRQP
jgi:LmbE family N-acetylglucosaminyl deacetylase